MFVNHCLCLIRRAAAVATVLVFFVAFITTAQAFEHPGGMHTDTDFQRMSNKVAQAAHPWVDSYNELTTIWMANLNMPWAPVSQIIRGGTGSNYARSQKDAMAIYYHALRWRITGDTNYAEEAITGMNLWSSTMTNGVGGDSNWALGAGICGYEFAVAGEALRGYPGWSQTSISNYANFLRIFAGGNDSFLVNHNGTCDSHYWCNWDACNLASLIACAVFCDDTNMFNRAVTYLKSGKGNGNLTSAAWFIHTNGLAQWQESGRDQAHTMDGVAWLGVACQVAWNQGEDLFGFDNNRLLRGVEYACKYNLWQDVPYQSYSVCEGASFDWGTLNLNGGGRGFLPPTWDLFYNHYVNLKGLSAPWTAQAATAIRPDGFYNNVNSPDFLGFTTLTCLQDPIPTGAVPSGLTARIYGTNVLLNWWGAAYATNYLVKRASVRGGPYSTLASIPASSERAFFDATVTNGGMYYYVVSAQDKFGESPNSPEMKIGINQMTTYYRFNETSGTTASEASGLSPSATLMNGASFTASGKFANAVSLNGSSQYVALPNGLISNLGDFTISAWIYLNSQNAWARLFDFGADTDSYMFLSPYNGSSMVFAITKFGGNGSQSIYAPALTAGAWHHVVVTLQRSQSTGVGTIYVDGVATASNTAMTFTPDMIGSLVNASNNYIGRSQYSADPYLNGRVDDFRIYNGALNAAQIAALYALNPVIPPAPTTVTATAASANVINLSWSGVGSATNYLVKRSQISGGPYTVVASGITATNYTDSGLTGNTTYYYVIAAANNSGTSANSVQASTTTLTPPSTPSGLVATGLYGGQIALSWNASGGATSYNIKRSLISGGPYVTIATGVSSTTYTNSGLVVDATYYYVVSAVNGNGESPNSSEASSIVPVPTLIWKGSVNTTWDIATTTNWLFGGSPSTYFVDGGSAVFDDTATTANVNLTANVSPYSVTFSNSSLGYTLGSANGSGIGGSTPIDKYGSGTVTLTGINTFTGDININGSGTLAIGGSGLLGGGNYSGNIANYATFNYASTATQTISGAISLTGTLLKSGTGTLTVSGPDMHTGPTVIRQGTLNLTGQPKSNNDFVYGIYAPDNNAASTANALLNISTSVTTYELWLGDRAGLGQVGAAYQTEGDVVLTRSADVNDFRIGSVAGGRGYYQLSGGSLSVNEAGIGGLNNDTIGIFDITGGTFYDSGYITIGRGGAASSGLMNITGGSATASRADINWAGTSGAISVINVGGGNSPASLTLTGGTGTGLNLASSSTAGTLGIVNLRTNGTLATGRVRASQPNPTALLNFDGGVLQANVDSSGFLSDASIDAVYVYPGGGTIDNGDNNINVDNTLLAPTGVGVNSISGPSTQGSGYVAPPLVTITGGNGIGATAYAVMTDDGTGKGTFKVMGIVVSSRGVYTAAPTTVTLTGGGPTIAASGFSISTTANNSGGMTFTGKGTTTLTGSNNYAGPTVVDEGNVVQGHLGQPLLYLSFDNTNGSTIVNEGIGGAVMDGTLTGAGISIINGGYFGNGLAVGASALTDSVRINSPVVNFNTSGTWSWAMWIRTTTAGGAYMYQGDGGWGNGNTSFYLNPGSGSTGTKGGGVRYAQGWQSGTSTLNDGNWHHIAMTCNNGTKVFYVDGAVDPWAKNEWGGNGTGGQLWIGGTGGTSGDGNVPLNGTIDEVYVFNRSLSSVEVTNLMAGQITNVLSPSQALPTGTDLTVASVASLVLVSSNQTIGALSGGNSGTIQLGAGSTPTALTFGKNDSSTFAGNIVGNGSVTKNGTGDITLSGINAYSGATTINAGKVKFEQSDNSNYVASLGPLLKLTFDQTNGGDIYINDNGDLVTNPIVVLNTGLGGTAMDGTLNGAGATIVGGGRYGNALSLNGSASVFINNKVTALDCNADGTSWTYALWIKTSTAGATYGYQGDGTWSSGMTTFYLNNNNATGGGTKAGGVRYADNWLTGTATLNNNAWHFIAITVSNGVKTIYVDGNVDAQTGGTGWGAAGSTSANQFWIGQAPSTINGEVPFIGLIDEVSVFNRALSQNEVQNIMANNSAVLLGVTTGQLPSGTPVSLASAATLDLSGTSQTIASLSDISSGGVVTNSAGMRASLLINGNSSTTFSGSIRGDLDLTKSGSGAQTLNGDNSYNGDTAVNGGMLVFGQASLPTNGIVTVTSGAVLSLNFSGTNRVAGLVLNGANQSPGIYNAFSSAPYLAGTGSLIIGTPVSMNPTNILISLTGDRFTLTWPLDHTGWHLQVQTNGLDSNGWYTVSDSTTTNIMTFSVVEGDPVSVFYRLVYP